MILKRIKNLIAWSAYHPKGQLPEKVEIVVKNKQQKAQIIKKVNGVDEFLNKI